MNRSSSCESVYLGRNERQFSITKVSDVERETIGSNYSDPSPRHKEEIIDGGDESAGEATFTDQGNHSCHKTKYGNW